MIKLYVEWYLHNSVLVGVCQTIETVVHVY
jgi:hypothetical protein